jgi:hypothetical protein|tara:strand:- start:201 stop:419 length:219 start_codon:yes stop_codon:yes gene_type:complete
MKLNAGGVILALIVSIMGSFALAMLTSTNIGALIGLFVGGYAGGKLGNVIWNNIFPKKKDTKFSNDDEQILF